MNQLNKVLYAVVRVMFIGNQLVKYLLCSLSKYAIYQSRRDGKPSIKDHQKLIAKEAHPSKSAIVLVNNSSWTTIFVHSFIPNGIRMVWNESVIFSSEWEKNWHFERLRPKCIIFLVLSPFQPPHAGTLHALKVSCTVEQCGKTMQWELWKSTENIQQIIV